MPIFWLLIICSVFCYAVKNPEEFVSVLAGTFTDGDKYSTGNTLPITALPWGFNHWAPQTKDGNRFSGSWWFKGNDHRLTWLRCTHQPSPWIGDWGWFLFVAQLENIDRNPGWFWEPRGSEMKPYVFDATVAPHAVRMRLSPTNHGAVLKVNYPGYLIERHVHVCFAEANMHEDSFVSNGRSISGFTNKVSVDRMPVSNFNMHFVAASKESNQVVSMPDITCFQYELQKLPKNEAGDHEVSVHIATSLISKDQAVVNYHREVDFNKVSFEQVYESAKGIWNEMLSRVDIEDEPNGISEEFSKNVGIFYTSLYRALLFPRRLDELSADNKVIHYSPYAVGGGVHEGPLCTDNGFWDTFRTVYPMLSLLYPDYLGGIVQGWLQAYKEGGWLPAWASPGYRNCMAGTYADVVVADAIVKGVDGFDLNVAKDAIAKDSFETPPPFASGAVGKDGLAAYDNQGFISSDIPGSDQVSRTLDFGFADYATSEALGLLAKLKSSSPGNEQEVLKLQGQSQRLASRAKRASSSHFDSNSGLMVPKSRGGGHVGRFADIEWGNGYMEGNAWQHSFPPYALDTLIQLHGSSEKLTQKLLNLINRPSSFQVGSYRQEIHEMTEARVIAMGQYAHNNQPSHHLLFLFAPLGHPEYTQRYVRHILSHAYGRDFYSGDEDNGENGAWFVQAALGLFSLVPGSQQSDYVCASPVFQKVHIYRGSRIAAAYAAVDSGVAGEEIQQELKIKMGWNELTISQEHALTKYWEKKGGNVAGLTSKVMEEVLPNLLFRYDLPSSSLVAEEQLSFGFRPSMEKLVESQKIIPNYDGSSSFQNRKGKKKGPAILTIEAPWVSSSMSSLGSLSPPIYVDRIEWNGKALDGFVISDWLLHNGGVLHFHFKESSLQGHALSTILHLRGGIQDNSLMKTTNGGGAKGGGPATSHKTKSTSSNGMVASNHTGINEKTLKLLREKDSKIALLEAQLKGALLSSKDVYSIDKLMGEKHHNIAIHSPSDDDNLEGNAAAAAAAEESPTALFFLLMFVLLVLAAWLGARLLEMLTSNHRSAGGGGFMPGGFFGVESSGYVQNIRKSPAHIV